MRETVIPRILAVQVVMVVEAVMIGDSVMEGVDVEVADIPVDVALVDEPEGYTVLPACRILWMIRPKIR